MGSSVSRGQRAGAVALSWEVAGVPGALRGYDGAALEGHVQYLRVT